MSIVSRDRRARHIPGEVIIQIEGLPSDVWTAAKRLEAAGFNILKMTEQCVGRDEGRPRYLQRRYKISLFSCK